MCESSLGVEDKNLGGGGLMLQQQKQISRKIEASSLIAQGLFSEDSCNLQSAIGSSVYFHSNVKCRLNRKIFSVEDNSILHGRAHSHEPGKYLLNSHRRSFP